MTTVVQLDQVTKAFRATPVVTDVSITVTAGESLAITGPNGSGKSVLLRMITKLLRPDSGTVTIDPRYLSRSRTFPEEFGIIIDRPGYIATRTGLDNLLELAAIRKRVGRSKVTAAMERVGLDPSARQRVGQYSLGMKQKLALAQSFMEHQQVLVLDEPFNALDQESVTSIRTLLAGLHHEGRTIIFTSHNPDDVGYLATRVVTINNHHVTSSAIQDSGLRRE